MAIQVSGTNVVDNNKKGIFTSVSPGSYTNSNRPGSPSAGDVIYNSTENEIQFWDGSEWVGLSGSVDSFYGTYSGSLGQGNIASQILPTRHGYTYLIKGFRYGSGDNDEVPGGGLTVSIFDSKSVLQRVFSAKANSGSQFTSLRAYFAVGDSSGNAYILSELDNSFDGDTPLVTRIDSSNNVWNRRPDTSLRYPADAVITSGGDLVSLWARSVGDGSILIKYDSSGNYKWGRRLNGSTSVSSAPQNLSINENDEAVGAGVDSNKAYVQSIYVGGTGNPTQRWGKRTTNTSGSSFAGIDNSRNVYHLTRGDNSSTVEPTVTKFNSSGTIQWQKKISAPSASGGYSSSSTVSGVGLGVDTSGNSYVFVNSSITDSAGVHAGFFIVKINSSGSHVWTRRFMNPTISFIPSGNYGYSSTMSVSYVRSYGDMITAVISTSYGSTYSGTAQAETTFISLNRDGTIPTGGGIGPYVVMLSSSAASLSNNAVSYTTQQTFASYGSSSSTSATWDLTSNITGAGVPGQNKWE